MVLLTCVNESGISICCYKIDNWSLNRMNYLLNQRNRIFQISPTRCTILLNIFISLLYMFRASMCSSSGESYCIYATLVFVTLYGWCLVCSAGCVSRKRDAARLMSCNIPLPGRTPCCPAPDLPTTNNQGTAHHRR